MSNAFLYGQSGESRKQLYSFIPPATATTMQFNANTFNSLGLSNGRYWVLCTYADDPDYGIAWLLFQTGFNNTDYSQPSFTSPVTQAACFYRGNMQAVGLWLGGGLITLTSFMWSNGVAGNGVIIPVQEFSDILRSLTCS